MSPARAPRPVTPVYLEPVWRPDGVPNLQPAARQLVVAASVTIALLRAAKVACLADMAAPPDHVRLTFEQRDAIAANLVPLSYLRLNLASSKTSDDEERSGTRTIVVCSHCGRWQVVAGTVQSGCALTSGCPGSILRPQPAARYTAAERSSKLATQTQVR